MALVDAVISYHHHFCCSHSRRCRRRHLRLRLRRYRSRSRRRRNNDETTTSMSVCWHFFVAVVALEYWPSDAMCCYFIIIMFGVYFSVCGLFLHSIYFLCQLSVSRLVDDVVADKYSEY